MRSAENLKKVLLSMVDGLLVEPHQLLSEREVLHNWMSSACCSSRWCRDERESTS
jgi:hypothetical protein